MELSSKKWKEFIIDEIFNVYTGTDLIISKIKTGEIPVVSHTANNNGIACWTKEIPNRTLFSYKTTISLADRGNFVAYVQPHDFYIGTRVKALEFKKPVPYEAMFFIAQQINKQSVKFSYGYNACDNINRMKIMLPINEKEEPDFLLMESYIKKVIISKQKRYNDYVLKQIENLTYKEIKGLEEKEWDEFFLIELFPNIQRGKRLTKANQEVGTTPYVSSTAINNGVDNYISNIKKVRIFENCLTVANSGSVGAAFYHPYKFVASDHVTHLKNKDMSMFVYLFISTMINRLSEKYNFNREINDKRICREKIMLPINNDSKPDYEYMEQYIKNIMIDKYNCYKKDETK